MKYRTFLHFTIVFYSLSFSTSVMAAPKLIFCVHKDDETILLKKQCSDEEITVSSVDELASTGLFSATVVGVQGEQGDIGLKGPDGIQGPAGPTGSIGVRGIDGIKGASGDRGEPGIAGPTGEKGRKGKNGVFTTQTVYESRDTFVAIPPGVSYTVSAECPTDFLIIGGGCTSTNPGMSLVAFYPSSNHSYRCEWQNVTGGALESGASFAAQVRCGRPS